MEGKLAIILPVYNVNVNIERESKWSKMALSKYAICD